MTHFIVEAILATCIPIAYVVGVNRNRLAAQAEIAKLKADIQQAKNDLIAAVERAAK